MDIRSFIQSFKPHLAPVPIKEQFRGALAGGVAILALGLALRLLPHFNYPPLMLGSIGATTLLMLAVPHSPMAQPWPLLGGNLVAAVVGWGCGQFIPEPVLAAACAVALAILLMHFLHCLHPPGAATALILVLGNGQFHTMGWQSAAYVVAANALILLVLALLINNMLGRHYPLPHSHPHHPARRTFPQFAELELEQKDIKWALTRMDGVIDVSEEDLAEIYELAVQHAQSRGRSG